MKPPSRTALFTARVAGQLAGLSMALVLMIASALLLGSPVTRPLRVMAALVLGNMALDTPTFGSTLVGFLAHQAGPSVLWSRIFGLILGYSERRIPLGVALGLGLVIGVIAEFLDVYLLMPSAQQVLHGHNLWRENIPLAMDWLAHLTYGLTLGLFFWKLQSSGTG